MDVTHIKYTLYLMYFKNIFISKIALKMESWSISFGGLQVWTKELTWIVQGPREKKRAFLRKSRRECTKWEWEIKGWASPLWAPQSSRESWNFDWMVPFVKASDGFRFWQAALTNKPNPCRRNIKGGNLREGFGHFQKIKGTSGIIIQLMDLEGFRWHEGHISSDSCRPASQVCISQTWWKP